MPPASKMNTGGEDMSSLQGTRPNHVSDAAMELLITEVLRYVERSTPTPQSTARSKLSPSSPGDKEGAGDRIDGVNEKDQEKNDDDDTAAISYAKEMAAAKMERMGYSVGYRLCERLSQNRTFSASGKDESMVAAAAQLEAVKFLCKEIWMEVCRKQIDKLQTNHRGVCVLKDHELRWLTRLPGNQEAARVTAIQLLAFPCTFRFFVCLAGDIVNSQFQRFMLFLSLCRSSRCKFIKVELFEVHLAILGYLPWFRVTS